MVSNPERKRLQEDERREKNWKRWGPYLSERQWGTVREDYSPDGSCWSYFSHDHARSRAYRWGEDGLLGLTDRECRLCLSLALWNERDPILKERLFGLTGPEGNHGEDVKEYYFYLDSSPTHSYMKALYKYPQREFPYAALVSENRKRDKTAGEFELRDTGIFDDGRYFDVFVEYAKNSPNDVLAKFTAINRGPEPAVIHMLPQIWFRNTWSWGRKGEGYTSKPSLKLDGALRIRADHETLGAFYLAVDCDNQKVKPPIYFTENETNVARLFGSPMAAPFVKDSFHEYVVNDKKNVVNPAACGTKAAAHFLRVLGPGETLSIKVRLFAESEEPKEKFGASFDKIFEARIQESDDFYGEVIPPKLAADEKMVMRQSYAGLLWTKQFYYYSVKEWLEGDPSQPAPVPGRNKIRNSSWMSLYNRDIISMPDKWEYPWYAAWDLAFHMIPFAKIDPHFAKEQLLLFLREWYMHPNGQIPAYEFAFGDVNPPVHAWACWRVYKIAPGKGGERDRHFLQRVFHKLLLNFTWWINQKDLDGNGIFSGGFLGLDNIGVFDRSQPLPVGGQLEQADGTAWMAFYCATMLSMALELAKTEPAYDDVASKFFEHFVSITDAINTLGGSGLWDEEDGFYYDQLHIEDKFIPLKTRSLVGLIPMLAVEVLDDEVIDRLPGFRKRMQWFLNERKDLARHISYLVHVGPEAHGRRLLAVPSPKRLERMLRYLLDESEFLSDYGIRSMSRVHLKQPYIFRVGAKEYRVDYVPGESNTSLFGGNSNWRGPIWFPINYLLIEALERYHHFYGEALMVECPAGSGKLMNLKQVSEELAQRLCRLFTMDAGGRRPCHGDDKLFQNQSDWQGLPLFYEYFHGDSGRGAGASHQTGWTALVTRCFERAASARNAW